jgi:hypothetical protein
MSNGAIGPIKDSYTIALAEERTCIVTPEGDGDVGYCTNVYLRAASDNTADVRVGNASVTANRGFFLAAGESVRLPVIDPKGVYCFPTEAGQVVSVLIQ